MKHLIQRSQFEIEALHKALMGEYENAEWRSKNTILGTLSYINLEVGDLEFKDTLAHAIADLACATNAVSNLEIGFDCEEELDETNYLHAANTLMAVSDLLVQIADRGIAKGWLPKDFSIGEAACKLRAEYDEEPNA